MSTSQDRPTQDLSQILANARIKGGAVLELPRSVFREKIYWAIIENSPTAARPLAIAHAINHGRSPREANDIGESARELAKTHRDLVGVFGEVQGEIFFSEVINTEL